jgi:lipoprotein-anchoring transpeptidase ErfK/SrfK
MIGSSARPDFENPPLLARPVVLLLGIGVTLLVLLSVALVAIVGLVSAVPARITVGVQDGAADLPLDTAVRTSVGGWSAHLEQVALYETVTGPDGKPLPEQQRPVQATPLRESRWPDGSEFSLRPADGPLSPDASYRLVVQGSAITSALPAPGRSAEEQEVRFSTVRSPVARAQAGPVSLKWAQPLQIQWDQPIQDVQYTITPPTPIKTAIDPNNPQLSTVTLENPDGGQTYKIAVASAKGANGIALSRPAEYTVIAPARPELREADDTRTVELGTPVVLKFSTPLSSVKVDVTPKDEDGDKVTSKAAVDQRDPTVVNVTLDGLAQGAGYELKVTEAVSRDGAPLAEPPTLALRTPDKLMIDTWDPEPEQGRISVKSQPKLAFTQPIRDRKAATAALSVEPNVSGRWNWLDDQTVQFVPTTALPYDTDVTIKLKSGPAGARSTTGSYFEKEAVLEYRTESDKVIDVNVTTQSMALYEKGKQVRTYAVATGVPGADTPIGDFTVEYKMPQARFVGTNVSGSHYDIPDVHWVLAFMGDYTIHGSYWRSTYGSPGSNGCVSLSDEDAKSVFDWAPEGTRIHIHY